jgi:hypothetical protein
MPNFSGIWSPNQQFQARGQNIWPKTPGAPTIGTATAGVNNCASVTFTAPGCTGYPAGVTGYRVVSTPGCFSSIGASSPIVVSGLTLGTSYTFKAQATNASGYGDLSAASNSITAALATCAAYYTPGTYTWVAPATVTSVSVVVVGGGGGATNSTLSTFSNGGGGGGGELRYRNAMAVTAGSSYTVVVGSGGAGGAITGSPVSTNGGQSSFTGNSSSVTANGGLRGTSSTTGGAGGSGGSGTGGGNGGAGGCGCASSTRGGGGGGAGGYSGAGGRGGYGDGGYTSYSNGVAGSGGGSGGGRGANAPTFGSNQGGSTALGGQGNDGAAGTFCQGFGASGGNGSTNIAGFSYPYAGGGAGIARGDPPYTQPYIGVGVNGGVRIVWCVGGSRGTPSFPSTNVGA